MNEVAPHAHLFKHLIAKPYKVYRQQNSWRPAHSDASKEMGVGSGRAAGIQVDRIQDNFELRVCRHV